MSDLTATKRLLPGLVACAAIGGLAMLVDRAEVLVFGKPWLEPVVLAILIGAVIRTVRPPGPSFAPGIDFCAKTVLELAIVVMGVSLSGTAVLAMGPALLAGIVGVVALTIPASYAIGRSLGLGHRMAVLVACGNSICGNSAIAAVAPVIGADGNDVAASIAFTAVLGVAVVLGLPLLVPILGLGEAQYGLLAGLTVYAVPQVLAATMPVGAIAVQIGTLVKLVRVLLLGPVVFVLALVGRRTAPAGIIERHPLIPWFILGFLVMAAARATGVVPDWVLPPATLAANAMTVLSMAALGLGVNLRSIGSAGGRVTATAILSILALTGFALALVFLTKDR